MAPQPAQAAFACKCLNVRITPTTVLPYGTGAAFITVGVNDDSIHMAHPQLTLRSRSAPLASNVQHVSLSCLVCHLLVYRVANSIVPGEDAKEGPILPTFEWTEKDVLRTATNEIDVSVSCLSADATTAARQSSQFSTALNVVLPTQFASKASAPQNAASPPAPFTLPQLPFTPLFPPPPFTPTHPAFVHLSTEAAAASEHRRRVAEGELTAIVQARIATLDAADLVLKAEVEAVWRAFRAAWQAEVDKLSRADGRSVDGAARPSVPVPSMSIREFAPIHAARPSAVPEAVPEEDGEENIPQLVIARQTSTPVNTPSRTSLLSASLSTSGFHHPRAQDRSASPLPPPPYASNPSTDSGGEDEDAPAYRARPPNARSSSSTSTLPLTFRRNMDQALDVGTSVRYISVLQEEAERAEQAEAGRRAAAARAAPSTASSRKRSNDKDKSKPPAETPCKSPLRKPDGVTPKGKQRKVTFDIEPEVVVIAADKEPPAAPLEEVEFFGDMDDMDAAHPAVTPPAAPPPVTPVRNPRAVNPRVRTSGLIASSYVPPSGLAAAPPPVAASVPTSGPLAAPNGEPDGEANGDAEYDATLRRLVGADLPTHRAAWRKGGRAWEAFRARRRPAAVPASDDEGTEDESSDDGAPGHVSDEAARYGLAQSVPIAFGGDEFGGLGGRAARAAAYAERDAARRADPGVALGLAEEPPAQPAPPTATRERVLSILQREDDQPDAGMWRSLA